LRLIAASLLLPRIRLVRLPPHASGAVPHHRRRETSRSRGPRGPAPRAITPRPRAMGRSEGPRSMARGVIRLGRAPVQAARHPSLIRSRAVPAWLSGPPGHARRLKRHFPLRPMVAVAPGARQGPRRGYCPETTQPRPRRRARAEASARVGCVLTQSPASISALVCRDRQPPGRCVARLVCIEVPGILPSASFRARPEGPCEPVPFAVEQRHFPSLFNHGHSLFPRMLPIRYFV